MTSITIYEAEKSGPLPGEKITLEDIRKAGQKFGGWALKEHYWGFLHGSFSRDNGYVERSLKKLVDRGELVAHPFEGKLAYSVKRVNRQRSHTYPHTMYHELNVTGGLIRFWWSDPLPKEYIPSSFFMGRPLKPEWALRLSSGTTILFEFCTDDNFKRLLKYKVERYSKVIEGIEKPMVVFVCDVEMERIKGFIDRNRSILTFVHDDKSISPFYFTDSRIFRNQALGEALTAPIYLWQDGEVAPLR